MICCCFSWEDRGDFEDRGKYTFLEMDYKSKGNDEEEIDRILGEKEQKESAVKSELPQEIQELVKLIFDKKMVMFSIYFVLNIGVCLILIGGI